MSGRFEHDRGMTENAKSSVGLAELLNLDPRAVACPHEVFRPMREEAPLHFIEETGCYAVTRFDDVLEIVRDPVQFSSRMPTGPHAGAALMARIGEVAATSPELAAVVGKAFSRSSSVLLSADPPDHGRQRRLVNTAFGPRRVGAMESEIESIANRLVDEFVGRGEVELVHEFAVGLPLTVIAKALGVEDRDLATFKRWSDVLVVLVGNHKPSVEQITEYVHVLVEFADYFTEKIEQRRVAPKDDLITDVVQARIKEADGSETELTVPEMLSMFQQFLVAGNETTTKLIASMMRLLMENREVMDAIRADPSLADRFVDEALRLETPVQGLYRQANVDTEVGGCPVAAGSHLWVLYASANRDASVFPEPDRVDLSRDNLKQHLAFSQGPHYCIGASLARAEGRVAVQTLLKRLANIELHPTKNTFTYESSYVLHGLQQLWLTFEPAV
jgi:cytochrome P450